MKMNVTIEMIDMNEVKFYTERTRSLTTNCEEDVNEFDIVDHIFENVSDYIKFDVLNKLEEFFADIDYVNDFLTNDELYNGLLELIRQF